ncbi:phosphatase PAP2 family protein [Spiroplasma gladiatoris]|uniref:Phosphatase PAP2 family protein n=1 Tax=Spiroplasma gladiatoris TaxID=2143 RepID=A0A4V1AQ65_9MOLU|nr:phosphatase PAP2 family protein [Spiroplasma gladiatoris]QBQ07419.1 phosphatase PAP2 family protein [Spiroplasma gladiatoris]
MLFKTKKNNLIFWIISFLIFFSIFTIASIYDYDISLKNFENYNQNNIFLELIMYVFNIYGHSIISFPVYISITLATFLVFKKNKEGFKKYIKIIISIFYGSLFLLSLLFFSFYKSIEDWNETKSINQLIIQLTISSVALLLGILTIIFIHLIFYTNKIIKTKIDIEKVGFNAVLCLIFILISMVVVYILKIGVARPRPREIFNLENPKDAFKYPFEISIKNRSGQSFPSGHTQSACSVFGLLFFIDKKNNLCKKLYYYLLVIFSILAILTGVSRILILAHFLTDVLMAYFICLVAFLITKYWLPKYLIKKEISYKEKISQKKGNKNG